MIKIINKKKFLELKSESFQTESAYQASGKVGKKRHTAT